MNKLQTATLALATASNGSPIRTTIVVMLFWAMGNFVFFIVEKLFFGGPFVHICDVIWAMTGMAYSAYAVYWCAVFNTEKSKEVPK